MTRSLLSPLRFAPIILLAAVAGCSPQDGAAPAPADAPETAPVAVATPPAAFVPEPSAPAPAPVVCQVCGTVLSVTEIRQEAEGSGVGAVIGGLVGGLAGNQVGGGSGRKIATVAGVIGGAVAGNTIEKNRKASLLYEVAIDMDSGMQRVLTVSDATGIFPGVAVTVRDGTILLQ